MPSIDEQTTHPRITNTIMHMHLEMVLTSLLTDEELPFALRIQATAIRKLENGQDVPLVVGMLRPTNLLCKVMQGIASS